VDDAESGLSDQDRRALNQGDHDAPSNPKDPS